MAEYSVREWRASPQPVILPFSFGLDLFCCLQAPQSPRYRVDEVCQFDEPHGKHSLHDLFGAQSQLLVCHFMCGPDWKEGCPICLMIGDHYDPFVTHSQACDVSLVTVSRAPIDTLTAYQQRIGWNFDWASSLNTDFKQDFRISFNYPETQHGTMDCNNSVIR